MKSAIIFVDFDNVANLHTINLLEPKQIHIDIAVENIVSFVTAWYKKKVFQPDELSFRFYGGWFETISAADTNDREKMLSKTLYNAPRRSKGFILRYNIANGTFYCPDIILTKTVRLKKLNINIPSKVLLTCRNKSNCLSAAVKKWQNKGCDGCIISHESILTRKEQKTIDTTIVADVIYSVNSKLYTHIGIVSGDYDLAPGIAYAVQEKIDVTIFRKNNESECDSILENCDIASGLTIQYPQI